MSEIADGTGRGGGPGAGSVLLAALCLSIPLALGGERSPRAASDLAFAARTLDGREFDFAEANARHKVVVCLFDPTGRRADALLDAAQRMHEERHQHNLAVVGVMMPPDQWSMAEWRPEPRPSSDAELAEFAQRVLADVGAAFPCVLDADGRITRLYERMARGPRPAERSGLFVFPVGARGKEGQARFASHVRRSPDPAASLYREMLLQLGIEPRTETEPLAGDFPRAPEVKLLDSKGEFHRLSAYRGRVVVLVFVVRTCPQCKAELTFLQKMRETYGPDARRDGPHLEVIAVCLDAAGLALAQFVAQRGYDFPVVSDAGWSVRGAFHFRGGTPDTFVIAPDGTIRYRHRDYAPELNRVLHMEIRTLLGLAGKPMLARSRYNGVRSCRICHEREHADWLLTRHACAWDTLVRLGRESDPECVRCHVVAYMKPGGFITPKATPHLADVQCESCHGRNGCAAFTGEPVPKVTKSVCVKCHDAKHSPRFDFEAALPRVRHTRAAELAKLPRAEREKELKKLCAGTGRQLFDPDTPYVGSEACGRCHPTELQALASTPHARATRILAAPAPEHWSVPKHKRGVVGLRKPECLRCHVTGFGRPGGFPASVPEEPASHPLAAVGCEACHGPGKAHVDAPRKPKAIAKLGGTCNECNILPICRQCHDDANAPQFDYRTALPKARHPVGEVKMPAK